MIVAPLAYTFSAFGKDIHEFVGKEVTIDSVRQLLGLPPNEAITGLLESVLSGSSSANVMQQLQALYDQGYQAAAIAKQLGQTIRNNLVTDASADEEIALNLLEQLIKVPAAHDPERFLAFRLLQGCLLWE